MSQPSERLSAPLNATDMELLRTFEPVGLFTRGEQFYPTDVNAYVAQSSLWEHTPEGRDRILVPQGQLDLQKLAASRMGDFGTIRYIRFVETLDLVEAAQALAEQVVLHSRLGNRFH